MSSTSKAVLALACFASCGMIGYVQYIQIKEREDRRRTVERELKEREERRLMNLQDLKQQQLLTAELEKLRAEEQI